MVARAGGYDGEPFRIERGITQGVILFSAIFNVVVDVVVLHWGSFVEERVGGGSGDDGGNMAQPAGRKI